MDKKVILEKIDMKAFYSSELPSFRNNGYDQALALCPFHEDSNPSLSINLKTGYFNCFGCGAKGSIFDFVMKRQNISFSQARELLANKAGLTEKQHRRIIKAYQYIDEEGTLLYEVVRYEPKGFSQRRPNGKDGWIWNLKGVNLVIYNLPDVLNASSVIIVEGERDVENLKRIGLVATCNPMGAGKWKREYNRFFHGKDVSIIADNDAPGMDHALQVARNLSGIAQLVKVVELQEIPEKGDVSDWIASGGSAQQLTDIINVTPEWKQQEDFRFLTVEDVLSMDEVQPMQWDVENLFPEGSLILLTAPPSHYKTLLSLSASACISEGTDFLGRRTSRKKVYYMEKENPKQGLKGYLRLLGIDKDNSMKIWPAWTPKEPPIFPSEEYKRLASEKPFIVFDSLIRFYPEGTDENSALHMSRVVKFLRELTREGATVLCLHHRGKSDSDYRGSSDLLGGVDVAYAIRNNRSKEPETLMLKCFKNRFGQERDLLVEIVRGAGSLRFLDATLKMRKEKEREDNEEMESIRQIIVDLGTPNQSELVMVVRKRLGLSKSVIRDLLAMGEGKGWSSMNEGRGKAIYYSPIVKDAFHLFHSNPSGKPERSADTEGNLSPLSGVLNTPEKGKDPGRYIDSGHYKEHLN